MNYSGILNEGAQCKNSIAEFCPSNLETILEQIFDELNLRSSRLRGKECSERLAESILLERQFITLAAVSKINMIVILPV